MIDLLLELAHFFVCHNMHELGGFDAYEPAARFAAAVGSPDFSAALPSPFASNSRLPRESTPLRMRISRRDRFFNPNKLRDVQKLRNLRHRCASVYLL